MIYGIAFFILAGIVFLFIQRAEKDDEPGEAERSSGGAGGDTGRNGKRG